jgi:hypothetical protein
MQRSLGRYSSLADSGHGVFLIGYRLYNLNYTPIALGVQSWREITSGRVREQKNIEYHWGRGLGEPRSRSGSCEEEKNRLPQPGIEILLSESWSLWCSHFIGPAVPFYKNKKEKTKDGRGKWYKLSLIHVQLTVTLPGIIGSCGSKCYWLGDESHSA